EEHDALRATTGYDLLGRDQSVAPNPAVPEGEFRALGLDVALGDAVGGLGADLAGGRGLVLRVEAGRLDALPDPYVRAEAALRWRVPTALRRRLFPLALDLRLSGGVSGGDLPPQRQFGIDGTVLGLAPFGAFRARRGRPYAGDRYAALAWSHDFRSVPFELLGLTALADRQIGVALHGAHGRSWDAAPGAGTAGWHHEVGLSLSGGFLLPVRLDLTTRLDEPGVFVTLGLARLF
ncbi:MAG: carboxypeptidase-like regulatory domain-containing protein, partial [Rhodothermales bacterium]|nr:carboxypeptidase-like regulatory domain-containing protein [Rhodothermales bacterium]